MSENTPNKQLQESNIPIENEPLEGGCDCLIEDDIQQEYSPEDVSQQGGVRRRNRRGNGSGSDESPFISPSFTSLIQEKTQERSPFETFNNDNDKRAESFENLHQMIKLYTKALKDTMSQQKESVEVIDDINFLIMEQNEEKTRVLFIEWNKQVNGLINSLSSESAKRNIRGISSRMSQLSYHILNEKIPNYKTYMEDVSLQFNEYKKHLKLETVVDKKQTESVKFAIDELLQGTSDKQILIDEFIRYDKKLFERLDVYAHSKITESSEEMQGYRRFKQLREHTVKTLISRLSDYEKEIRSDIASYKNHRPSEKEYEELLLMYKELYDSIRNNTQEKAPTLENIMGNTRSGYEDMYLGSKDQFYEIVNKIQTYSVGNTTYNYVGIDFEGNKGMIKFSRMNVDQLYTRAFTSIVTLINNYEFLLKYCNALKQLNYQFKGVDIKSVIVDIIANYYMLLYFSPGAERIYIRQLEDAVIEDEANAKITKDDYKDYENYTTVVASKQIVPWNQLSKDNAEYKFYNAISNIVYNSVKGLYGTFNLLIEYYLKPEKSLSQVISGGDRERQDTGYGASPIGDALVFYKLVKICYDEFMRSISSLKDAKGQGSLTSQLQLFTSNKFYDLYMYFQDTNYTQDLNKYISICNKLWNSAGGSVDGIISQRCKNLISEFIKELTQSLISKIYIGDSPYNSALDQMSNTYGDIRKSATSLYTTAIYSEDRARPMQMPPPDIGPMKQKDELIDTYMAVSQVIDQFTKQKFDDFDVEFSRMDKDYKKALMENLRDQQAIYRKIQRPEQKYIFFQNWMAQDLFTWSGFKGYIQSQVKFARKMGVAMNQYTVFIGQVIKIMVLYHKKYVELDNFPKSVGHVLKYKLAMHRDIISSNNGETTLPMEIQLYRLFVEQGRYSYQRSVKDIIDGVLDDNFDVKSAEMTNTLMKKFTKLESDLLNNEVLYTYILIKTLSILEEYNTITTYRLENATVKRGISGSVTDTPLVNLIEGLYKMKIIKVYESSDNVSDGNLPFNFYGTASKKFWKDIQGDLKKNMGYPENEKPQSLWILTEQTFRYLQQHSPYMRFAYYTQYSEYAEEVELITSIPGVKISNGIMSIGEFLSQLEQKRQAVLHVFQEFRSDANDSQSYEAARKQLENGLNYHAFFEDAFAKYCPGPLPLTEFVAFNTKNYILDFNNWYYSFPEHVYSTEGKLKLTYKEETGERDILVKVYSPFKFQGISDSYSDGIKTVKVSGSNQQLNIQLELIDKMNYHLQKYTNIIYGYTNSLPKEFVEELSKNSVIQQSLITTPIEYNGSVFNIPVNTLQMPFQCPALLGLQNVDQLPGSLTQLGAQDDIANMLHSEGCFFTNDTLEIFMMIAEGKGNRRELTNAERMYWRTEYFDKIARKTDGMRVEYNDSTGDFKTYHTVDGKEELLTLKNSKKQNVTFNIADKKINIGNESKLFNEYILRCIFRTFQFMSNPEKLSDAMRMATDLFYDYNTFAPITRFTEWTVKYVKIDATLAAYNKWKEQNDNSAKLYKNKDADNLYKMFQDSTSNILLYSNLTKGDAAKTAATNPPAGQDDATTFKASIGNMTQLYLPLFISLSNGKYKESNSSTEQFNLVKSAKFAALSDVLKKQYTGQFSTITVPLIYNKEKKSVQLFKESIQNELYKQNDVDLDLVNANYKDDDAPLIYMSNAMMLQNPVVVTYSETQQYGMLYDLIRSRKELHTFMQQIQGIQVPKGQEIMSVLTSLDRAIQRIIDKCKGILRKPGVGPDMTTQYFTQYLFDPLQFVNYNTAGDKDDEDYYNDTEKLFKKLYIQFVLGENFTVESGIHGNLDANVIKNYFIINHLIRKFTQANTGYDLVFRINWQYFQRAAFIKRRTPQKQIIGEDHYWIISPTADAGWIVHKNQGFYKYFGQNYNARGWFYDQQKSREIKLDTSADTNYVNIYKPDEFEIMKNINMINISDNPQYANLFKFNYAFIYDVSMGQNGNWKVENTVGYDKLPNANIDVKDSSGNTYVVPGTTQDKDSSGNPIVKNLKTILGQGKYGGASPATYPQYIQWIGNDGNVYQLTETKADGTLTFKNISQGTVNQTIKLAGNIANGKVSGSVQKGKLTGTITDGKFTGNVQNGTYTGNITDGTFTGNVQNGTFSGNVTGKITENNVTRVIKGIVTAAQERDIASADQTFNITTGNVTGNDITFTLTSSTNQALGSFKGNIRYTEIPLTDTLTISLKAPLQLSTPNSIVPENTIPETPNPDNIHMISPLAIMQEITYFAGITNPATLNLGRDVYGLEYAEDSLTNKVGKREDKFGMSYYGAIQGITSLWQNSVKTNGKANNNTQYNPDFRDLYIQYMPATGYGGSFDQNIVFLISTPCKYIYEILTHDYRLISKSNTDADANKWRRKYIFSILNIEPFNPIQLIKKNMPYPIMQAMSIYINMYEKKYLGNFEQVSNSNVTTVRLNQMWRNRPVFIITDQDGHPLKSGTLEAYKEGDLDILVDTSSGQDVYYTYKYSDAQDIGVNKVTLPVLKEKRIQSQKHFIMDITKDDDVELGEQGYFLKGLLPNTATLRTTIPEGSGEQETNILKLLFTVIPQYFYYNSKLLSTAQYTKEISYEKQPNGQLIMKENDKRKKYMW